MSPTDGLSSQEKLEALGKRSSNAEQVERIESSGHVTASAVTAVAIGGKAISIAGAGGIGAVACYAAPFAAGIAGAIAGAALVNHFALDEKLLDFMGKPRLVGQGPQPATIGHAIAHSSPFAGALGGLLAGVAIGALCAVAAAAVVGTGGLAAPLIIAAAAGLGGSFTHSLVNGFFSKAATVTGKIIEGSPDVFFEGRPVARVTDQVLCSKHTPPPPRIAEGSETIFINGLPLARIGHKITCGAVIQEGCATIFADNTTTRYGPVDSQMSVLEQSIVSLSEVALCLSAVRFRSSKLGKKLFGEPVDPSDGEYVDFRTDFEYPGMPSLALSRIYSGKDRVDGLLGTKWLCNWSQRLVYDTDEPTVTLEDSGGEALQFSLGARNEFNARNLKASHYHLTGTKEQARLFDSRCQQTLVFETTEANPDIGRLTAIEDRNNNRIDFIYAKNRLRRVEHSDGEVFIVRTTPEGFIETVTRDNDNEPLVRYGYDSLGTLTDVHSLFGGEFHYTYTEEGWLKRWQDSGATSVDIAYDSEGRVVATRTPDGMYNDWFIYHPDERKTEYHDAEGGCFTYWFNGNNQVIREQDPLGNITTHEVSGLDRRLSITDALGRTTTYAYDTFGNLMGETDGAGRTTSYTYDRNGQLTGADYPDGTSSSWKYDDRGNLLEAKEPDGSVWRFSYDDNGRLISETGPDGAATRLGYDPHGRLASLRNALGQTTRYDLDRWGRPLRITDPGGHSARYHYDHSPDNPRGDISRIIYPDKGEECFAYDSEGLPKTYIAQEGQTTRYTHGSFDLLRSITDPKGCATRLDYDNAARLKKITNAQGQTWTYRYDPAGNLASETDWAGRQTTYTRDAIGRVLTKRLPDGVEQRLTWDDRDRITAVETTKQRIVYEYDNADRLIRASTYTKSNPEPDSDLLFFHDDKGRLTREIQNGTVIEYRYDLAGRLVGRSTPSGETGFSYDLLGQFKSLSSNGHALDFSRESRGLESLRTYCCDDSRSSAPCPLDAFFLRQSYDPCGRLKSQLAGRERQTAIHERLAQVSRRYSWDKSGRLVGVQDDKHGTSAFRYDPRDQIEKITRVTGLNRQTEERFSYDALMNLAQSDGQSHHYQDGTVRTIGKSSYRYDVRGRVIEKRLVKNGFRPKTWQYRWDDFDRLIETHTPDGKVWRYTYDAFGRRIRKECVKPGASGTSSSISYLWQGATLAEEQKISGVSRELSRWHFEPGTFNPVAKETLSFCAGAVKAGEPRFYPIVTDHMGTPKELFDTEGNCLWQAEHELWGRVEITAKKTDNYQPVVDCNLRFQNQWEDEESGLYYNLNRYYDPDSGQYLSADPVGLEGGLRTHGYVHDPMQWVDPLGLAGCPKKPIVLGETMPKRVLPVARKLGAHTFKPRSNNPARWKVNQKRWIKDQMNSGRDMYDIGTDRLRPTRSDYYKIERTELKKAGYERVYQRRIKVDVDGSEKEFRLYKWEKMR